MKSLSPNSGVSSTRVSLYWVVGMAGALVASIIISTIIQAATLQPIDWMGVAAAIGAIGVFLTPAFGAKVWQKRYETKRE